MELKILNLCSHVIKIKNANGDEVAFPPENRLYPARVQNELQIVLRIGGVDICKRTKASSSNLPPMRDGYLYIVSRPVAAANPERHDLLIPCGLVKDEVGDVQYCTGLEVI